MDKIEKEYEIQNIVARQILDSRGNPTCEVDVWLTLGGFGRFSVPSGASTGSFEAVELRDGDKSCYNGKSVEKAVSNVNEIIKNNIISKKFNQKSLDSLLISLDGTKNKSNLGANAILGVSMAFLKACANQENLPLYKFISPRQSYVMPSPMMNVINGGKHADNNLNIQEFMIIPTGCTSFKEALRKSVEVYHTLKNLLKGDGLITSVGDEGGFAPSLENDEVAIEYLIKAIKKAGYEPQKDFFIALDVAASEMKSEADKISESGKYYFWKTKKLFTKEELLAYYVELCKKYPIISIEDPFDEEDYESFKTLTKEIGEKVQIVGDDLYVTNIERLKIGVERKLSTSVLIKLNQIGTFSETMEAINFAQKNNFTCVISHRSGETEDTTIADIAVATNAGQIKTGALSRTDRVCKYNQLLRIEEELKENSEYEGKNSFNVV